MHDNASPRKPHTNSDAIAMNALPAIRGILFDLDGVLYVGAEAIDGALETVARIRASGMACRFVTNTSTLSLDSLQQKINALGFAVSKQEIISAPQAAVLYLRQQQNPVCRLLLADDVKQDFAEFRQPQSSNAPLITSSSAILATPGHIRC